MICRVVCDHQLADAFQVNTGVIKWYLLSPFLSLLAINRVLKTSTPQGGNRIQWTPWTQLNELGFADDLALLSHTQQQMQEKTSTVVDNSDHLGLKIHRGKMLKWESAEREQSSFKLRTKAATLKTIQAFTNNWLRWILRIRWLETTSNRELWKQIKQQPAEDKILQRRWR